MYLPNFASFLPLLAFHFCFFALSHKIPPMSYSFGAFPPFFGNYHGPQIALLFSKVDAWRLHGYTVGF